MVVMAHAMGRVESIRSTLQAVLDELGPSPARSLLKGTMLRLPRAGRPRYYRFFTREMLASFLTGMARALQTWGSLEAGLLTEGDTWFRVDTWLDSLRKFCPTDPGMLLPRPNRYSPLKRPMLFLRWMVRRDAIDPGGWTRLRPSDLVVPLDTHLFRWGKDRGLITRGQPDRMAAQQLTEALRTIEPGDPCRYDFGLAQLGMHRHRGQKHPGIL